MSRIPPTPHPARGRPGPGAGTRNCRPLSGRKGVPVAVPLFDQGYPIFIGGELYESVGVEAPILLSYTHKKEWNTHGGLPTRCQRSAMGVSLIVVGVRQQNGCFDTHIFIQFSTYANIQSNFVAIIFASLRLFLPVSPFTYVMSSSFYILLLQYFTAEFFSHDSQESVNSVLSIMQLFGSPQTQ